MLLALRPEKVRVLQEGALADNRVDGRVAECLYGGDDWHVQLEVDGIGRLHVAIPTWRSVQPQQGAVMQVGWDRDASQPVAPE